MCKQYGAHITEIHRSAAVCSGNNDFTQILSILGLLYIQAIGTFIVIQISYRILLIFLLHCTHELFPTDMVLLELLSINLNLNLLIR
ncbi:hypothetical protein D1872_226610 [compost metagenome]